MKLRFALFALIVTGPLLAADPPLDRKQLKPGLVTFSSAPQSVPLFPQRLDPTVALFLKAGEAKIAKDNSSALVWSGYIQIVTPGEYTFSANIQNVTVIDVSLKLGGKNFEVLKGDNSSDKKQAVTGKSCRLDAGYYQFQAVFVDMSTEANQPRLLELLWEGPGFKREPIPWFFFSHTKQQLTDAFKSDARLDQGRFLFEEMACIKCHADSTLSKTLVERTGPDLSKIGARTFPGWLDAWLADPAKLRPHTTMPKMFAETNAGRAERYAMVQFLSSLGGPLKEVKAPTFDNNYKRTLESGNRLFTITGCAACHGPKLAGTMTRNEDDDEPPPLNPLESYYAFGSSTGAQSRYALGGIGSKTTPDELAKYLKDPQKYNPHGRMPNMNLSDGEARDIARHLMRFTEESIEDRSRVQPPKWDALRLAEEMLDDAGVLAFTRLDPSQQWKSLGQRLFTTKGCANCHSLEIGGKKQKENTAFPSLAAIRKDTGSGCLAVKPVNIAYALDAGQRMALREYVASTAKAVSALSPFYQTRAALKRFNCLNCHEKDGEGSIGSELADSMKKFENAQNADDVLPPRLTGIGHKATTAWLNEVLVKGGRARPWMSLRMPQYGEAHVGFLAGALAACEGVPTDSPQPKPKLSTELVEQGRKLVGKDGGLGCIACHDISGTVAGGTRGPDLALNDRRVRREWYSRWMHNPQRLSPGTRMPSNFTDGRSVSTLLGADADAQIAAIWTYLSLGPGLPMPSGLEPPSKGIPLLVKDRPELLRTFLPDGAGTRPIAVGFPGGGAYAFDTHANRVAYAWEGNFLDVQPVWANRGGNEARLLGPKFFTPPPGQPWALTSGGKSPDFAKRAPDYAYGAPVPFQKYYGGPMRVHFSGYTLDTLGRPTFRYSVDDATSEAAVSVSDTPLPLKSPVAAGLERSFAVDGARLNGRTLWFAVATTTGPPRLRTGNGTILPVDLKYVLPAGSGLLILPQPGERAVAVQIAAAPQGTYWQFIPGEGKTWYATLKFPPVSGTFELAFTVWAMPRDDDALLPAGKAAK